MNMKCVVKRRGHEEKFSDRKLYRSCYYACKSAEMGSKECAKISKDVTAGVKRHIGKKSCVSSSMIHKTTLKLLRKHSKDAAFMYETHRDIS